MRRKALKTETKMLVLLVAFLLVMLLGNQLHQPKPINGVAITTSRIVSEKEIIPEQKRVNINTSTASELEELPKIGEVLANRIVDYRTEHGLFERIEDLQNVYGIGEKTFAAIADKITMEDSANENSGGR